jgi:hypothetical protein
MLSATGACPVTRNVWRCACYHPPSLVAGPWLPPTCTLTSGVEDGSQGTTLTALRAIGRCAFPAVVSS